MNTTLFEVKAGHQAMEREVLEGKVRGTVTRGRTIVPGLIGRQVSLTLVDERELKGTCLGFLTVNGDMDVRSPYLTIEHKIHENAVRRDHIPPNKIYLITEI
jgi:hypothetical protein